MISLLGETLTLIWSILKVAFLILKTITTVKVHMIAFVLDVPAFVGWVIYQLSKVMHIR